MKVKRRQSTAQLLDRMERRLLEAQSSLLDNYVDPRSAYIDDATGERWDPIGFNSSSRLLDEGPPYRNEEDLAWIRRIGRRLSYTPYGENMLKSLVSYVIGSGHIYRCVPKDGVLQQNAAKQYACKTQIWVDTLLDENDWDMRQQEGYRRYHRDGEILYRIFPLASGGCRFRQIQPWQLKTPAKWRKDPSADFGIKTDPDDVETPEFYFVGNEEVDAYQVQHRKANVDMTDKRGVSSLFLVRENLERSVNVLRNMSTLVTIQSSIALIRKHKRNKSAVENFVNSKADFKLMNRLSGKEDKFARRKPGTIIDIPDDMDYEFPSVGLNPAAPVGVLGAECRAIASSQSMPEYMVGSNASNANYSSTMVAESPFVRYIESQQKRWIKGDLDLIWTAIEYAIDSGELSPEVRKLVDIQAVPPTLVVRKIQEEAAANDIYLRNRVKSPQGVAQELNIKYEDVKRDWLAYDDMGFAAPLPTGGQPYAGE